MPFFDIKLKNSTIFLVWFAETPGQVVAIAFATGMWNAQAQ